VTNERLDMPSDDSDRAVLDYIARNSTTLYHPTSSCPMGSVVDSELRVLGMESLRVIDASVMPTAVRGNTNAPTIMIAERAADLIKGRVPATEAQTEAVAAAS
jgi:choline dehydrogenase-like flavoprotein